MHERSGILVIQSMGLGDVYFALPFLQSLRRAYPGEGITFLTNRPNIPAARMVRHFDDVLAYEPSVFGVLRLIQEVRVRRFRAVFVLNPLLRGALLGWLAGIPERVGYLRDYERKQSLYGLGSILYSKGYVPREEKVHETERYLDLLRFHAAPGAAAIATDPLMVAPEAVKKILELIAGLNGRKGPLIGIIPGAAWKMRRWPSDRFTALAAWLGQEYHARIVFFGNGGEKKLIEEIRNGLPFETVSLAGEISLDELGAAVSLCDLIISNDTGPMHMASALGKPVVALFGPGDPGKCAPVFSRAEILYHRLPCSPCRFQYTNLCESNLCMQEITVREAAEAAAKFLGNGKQKPALPVAKSVPDEKKKILFVQSTSEIGGSDITLLRMIRRLDTNYFEAHVLLPKPGPLVADFEKAGAKVYFMPDMKKLTLRFGLLHLIGYALGFPLVAWEIAMLIWREGIDLVHTNTVHNLYGFLAAKIAGRPHIWHIREIVVQSRVLWEVEKRLVTRFSDRFIVMDGAIAYPFLGKTHGFPRNLAKVYDGVDLERFSPRISGERIRRELGFGNEDIVFGKVCRLDPWKGVELYLEACALAAPEIPKAKFWICGGDIEGHEGYEARLKDKARRLGIGDRVIFSGWQYRGEEIPEVYAALDVSVQCPVNPEPYGLANIEAMAAGKPAVAPREGGPAELCVHEKTGLLFEPRNARAAADAMVRLARDPQLRRSMGLSGRERAEELFEIRSCVQKIENLYVEVLS